MDRIFVLLLLISTCSESIISQYFQQRVDYDINVLVDEDLKQVQVNGKLKYHNNAPYAIDTIYFHLWANSFSRDGTAFSDQLLKFQNTKFYFGSDSLKGGYRTLRLGEEIGKFEFNPSNPDMGYLVLKDKLNSNSSIEISIEYDLRLPYRYSRMGYDGDYVQLSYWYPKPAVLDHKGWHWFPYLNLGEFYSDYGDYDVEIKVPKEIQIVGTGTSSIDTSDPSYEKYNFNADDVIDFTLVMNRNYKVKEQVYKGKSGDINLQLFYDHGNNLWGDKAMDLLQESLNYYEEAIGAYPYPSLVCVQQPSGLGGGMEYPMLITVSGQDVKTLDYYINHEVGHQWFYGILGFNEREEPFLDEGLTTYFEHRYTIPKLGMDFHTSTFAEVLGEDIEIPILQQVYLWQKKRAFSESPSTSPQEASVINYGVNSYERAAYVFDFIADYIGAETFNEGIQEFYKRWKFKHPDTEDLINSLEDVSGKDLSWMKLLLSEDVTVDFKLSKSSGGVVIENKGNIRLPYEISTGEDKTWKEPLNPGESVQITDNVTSVNEDYTGLELNGSNNHLQSSFSFKPFFTIDHSQKKELYYTFLGTWNKADGWGIGTAFYNSTFPSKKFQFLLAPQYGFSSKQLIGNGWLAYNTFKDDGPIRKIQYKLSARRYSFNHNEDLDYRTQYFRGTPQVSLHFKVPPASQVYKKMTIRSIWLNEEFPVFAGDGSFEINSESRLIHQLRYDFFDFNVLNRKEYYLQLEQQSYDNPFGESENYLKLSGTLTYDIKYKPMQTIRFRAYAAGFLLNSQRNSSSFNNPLSRGTIALLNQGANDYTYENYFLNRQQDNGPFTNQVNRLEGGFKDALGPSYNIGLSNDFAASIGVSFDLPMNLPRLFKLKPYFDIGYYRTKSTLNDPLVGKTIYSGGLMLSYLDGSIEVYFPIFSSSEINDVYSELDENLFQRISFSIDLHRINPWDLIDDLNF